jgi:transposase
LEAVRKQASGRSGEALRGPLNQIYAWKEQLPKQVAWSFDGGAGHDAEVNRDREIKKLHAKIGQLIVERDL